MHTYITIFNHCSTLLNTNQQRIISVILRCSHIHMCVYVYTHTHTYTHTYIYIHNCGLDWVALKVITLYYSTVDILKHIWVRVVSAGWHLLWWFRVIVLSQKLQNHFEWDKLAASHTMNMKSLAWRHARWRQTDFVVKSHLVSMESAKVNPSSFTEVPFGVWQWPIQLWVKLYT